MCLETSRGQQMCRSSHEPARALTPIARCGPLVAADAMTGRTSKRRGACQAVPRERLAADDEAAELSRRRMSVTEHGVVLARPVLIVDGADDLRDMLVQFLRLEGFAPMPARHGVEA